MSPKGNDWERIGGIPPRFGYDWGGVRLQVPQHFNSAATRTPSSYNHSPLLFALFTQKGYALIMLSEDGGNAGNSRATDGPAFEKSNSSNPEMATSQIGKSPPPEKPEAIRLRTLVICSFWAVIICLGLPMWWKTTSIYRARLPLQDMMEWADGKVLIRFKLDNPHADGSLGRRVDQSFHYRSRSTHRQYKLRKQSISYGPPSMLSMI